MITITTDFGTRDGYVAAMKGTILDIHPEARLVDVTHEVSAQDVMGAAFVLRSALPYLPDGSVHLVVVDPGVGTERRAVALRTGSSYYVGPDNGVFPLALDEESPDEVVELDNPDAWRTNAPSETFHGRDIFAPVAAHLAAGKSLGEVGTPIDTLEPLRWARPSTSAESVQGWIAHVDHFGNCITNIRRSTLSRAMQMENGTGGALPQEDAPDTPAGTDADGPALEDLPPIRAYVGNAILDELHATYGEVAEDEPVLLFGSTGFLEVAVNGGNAAELLDIRKGDSIKLVLQSEDDG
jgi:hypothetical protein